jgi:spermidine dehydrogenase
VRDSLAVRYCRRRCDSPGQATSRPREADGHAVVERNIRGQSGRVLGDGGFDPAGDIEAITVNRWPHGYAYEYNSLYDPVWPAGQAPHEIGRQPFGRIHIANSDAGAFAYTNEAIDQGYRAVQEIVAKRA